MAIIGYGIGRNYEKYKQDFKEASIVFDYLCDARWKEIGEMYDGIPIISPVTLRNMKNVLVIVIVTERQASKEIIQFLEKEKIEYKSLWHVISRRKQKKIVNLIEQAAADNVLEMIYDALQDSESEILFEARIKMSMWGDVGELYKVLINLPRTDATIPVSEPYYCRVCDDLLGTVRRLIAFQDTTLKKKVVLCRTSLESRMWISALRLKIDAVLEDEALEVDYFPECSKIDIDTAIKEFMDAIFISGNIFDGNIKHKLLVKGVPEKSFKMRHTCWKSQYFDEPFIRLDDHEVFVDAGVLDLSNAFDFIRICAGKCDKVYALEPNKKFYEKCLERLNETESDKIELLNAAAWSCDTELDFLDSIQGSSTQVSDMGGTKVNARSVDSILQGKRVTYIKMDIEGAELEALKGAKESIKKWRPRLAICVYHKPEDIIELPAYILSLVPDYKLYIRHYSTCAAETVLYCL